MEDKAQLESDIVAALCAPPRHKPGEVSEEWVEYSPWSLSGLQQQAGLYLGHLGIDSTNPRWKMTRIIQRALEENPELIVMAARMKKLMTS
tara:strand:+ start:1002 stop:1274 length:273 start_codon:yes stop_codon:yes gene_type:complete